MTQKTKPLQPSQPTPPEPRPKATTRKPAQKPVAKPKATAKKSRPSKAKPTTGEAVEPTEVVEATEIVPASELIEQLKPDEAAFIQEYFDNGSNGTQAALKIWPHLNYASAGVTADRVLKRAQGLVSSYMDAKGLTLDILLAGVVEGLSATEAITIKEKIYKEGRMSKQTEKLAFSADFKTRHKYIELALKLRGTLTTKPPEIVIVPVTQTNNTSNILNLNAKKDMLDGFLDYMEQSSKEKLLRNVNKSEVPRA